MLSFRIWLEEVDDLYHQQTIQRKQLHPSTTITKTIAGWHIYFINDEEHRNYGSHVNKHHADFGTDEENLKKMYQDAIVGQKSMEQNGEESWNDLLNKQDYSRPLDYLHLPLDQRASDVLEKLTDHDHQRLLNALSTIFANLINRLPAFIQQRPFLLSQKGVFRSDGKLNPPIVDENQNVSMQQWIINSLKKTFNERIRTYHQAINNYKQASPFQSDPKSKLNLWMQKKIPDDLKTIEAGLTSLNRLLPQNHRLPIYIHYVTEFPRSFGTSTKSGEASYEGVSIFRSPNMTLAWMQTILAHEIGHTIFAEMTPKQKQNILQLAQKVGSPSSYGKLNYVYSGRNEPHENHTSGDEWFAEIVANIMFQPQRTERGIIQRVGAILSSGIESVFHPDSWRTRMTNWRLGKKGRQQIANYIQNPGTET